MFRKLVSNIRFSPALVGQLAFYANRLRKEEMTRRVGLVFIALALVVQVFAVFQAPEPANAANFGDMVYGGLGTGSNRSLNNFLRPYDANTNNLRHAFDYAGITREEIAAATYQGWNTQGTLSYGWNPVYSYAQGERAIAVKDAQGTTLRTLYARPMTLANGNTTVYGWVGYSKRAGWFAILQSCGNLVTKHIPPEPTPPQPPAPTPTATCAALGVTITGRTSVRFDAKSTVANGATISEYRYVVKDASGKQVANKNNASTQTTDYFEHTITTPGTYTAQVTVKTSLGDKTGAECTKTFTVVPPEKCPLNPDLSIEDEECQPCPDNPTIWIKDEDCAAKIVRIKEATNTTQQRPATEVSAKGNDEIHFTITARNDGNAPETISFTDNIADTLEYAEITDNGGGTLNNETKDLSWGDISIGAHQEVKKTFIVKMKATIPAQAQGVSLPSSYDCKITNVFGNSVTIPVDCPPAKTVEQTVTQLPHTGPTENIIFGSIILAVAAFFYARSRQLKQEVRLVRRNLNTGTL